MLEARQADHPDQLPGLAFARGAVHAFHLQPVGDVVEHRLPGKQRVLLEHQAALRVRTPDERAVEPQLTARGPQMPGQRAQQRRLAAARGAQQADELAGRGVDRHLAQDIDTRIPLADLDAHLLDQEPAATRRRGLHGLHGRHRLHRLH